ncbi:MAG: helix-turn-helix transcriptional regulator, partial [Alistipes sp.]|nr:helix-turn-helix transcriptional regulator [Alistipes sp.]
TSFKKEFRRYFHTSPHKWFINQRLQIAHTMLLSTDQTVEQIGNYCCLHNPSHFISRFRERYNMTPKVFRQIVRGER